jgi:queuine/archaeosine tRNA-ribosyltransferase
MNVEGLRFFFGEASGSAKKTLQKMEEPDVMISFATKTNTPWYGIDTLFIDSGGYTLLKSGKGHPPKEKYQTYLQRWQPDLFALRDYPCEPDLLDDLGETVESHQEKTAHDHAEMLDMIGELNGKAVSVLQGWTVDDYLRCIELFDDYGIPMNFVGVGSVCRRNSEREIRSVLTAIRRQLPDAHLHAFGVKTSVLRYRGVADLIDSADSLAYSYATRWNHDSSNWKNTTLEYLRMRKSVKEAIQTNKDDAQAELTEIQI